MVKERRLRGLRRRAVLSLPKGVYRSDSAKSEDDPGNLEDPPTLEDLERRPKGVVVIQSERHVPTSPLPQTHARQQTSTSTIVIPSDNELAWRPDHTTHLTSLETETFHDSDAENRPPTNHFIPNHPINQLRTMPTPPSTLGQRTSKKRGHSSLIAHSIEPLELPRRRSLAEIEVGEDWQTQRSKRQHLDPFVNSTSPVAGPATVASTRREESTLGEGRRLQGSFSTARLTSSFNADSELDPNQYGNLPAFARTRLQLEALLSQTEAANEDLRTHLTTAIAENEELHREIRDLRHRIRDMQAEHEDIENEVEEMLECAVQDGRKDGKREAMRNRLWAAAATIAVGLGAWRVAGAATGAGVRS